VYAEDTHRGESIGRVFGSEEILKKLGVGFGGNDRREDVITTERM
jgi:hypothetical protein